RAGACGAGGRWAAGGGGEPRPAGCRPLRPLATRGGRRHPPEDRPRVGCAGSPRSSRPAPRRAGTGRESYAIHVVADIGGGRMSAFVGRERELDELLAAFEDAASGRGRLFLISGEPGIGKSRLADELTDRARVRRADVL